MKSLLEVAKELLDSFGAAKFLGYPDDKSLVTLLQLLKVGSVEHTEHGLTYPDGSTIEIEEYMARLLACDETITIVTRKPFLDKAKSLKPLVVEFTRERIENAEVKDAYELLMKEEALDIHREKVRDYLYEHQENLRTAANALLGVDAVMQLPNPSLVGWLLK